MNRFVALPHKLPHEVVLSLSAKVSGWYTSATHIPYCWFRVSEVVATDSLGGAATKVHHIFVGNSFQGSDLERARIGTLSRDVSMRGTFERELFDACHPLITITFNVEFLADCDWSCTLRGEAVKLADDTRESLRARALDEYRQKLLTEGVPEKAVEELLARMHG